MSKKNQNNSSEKKKSLEKTKKVDVPLIYVYIYIKIKANLVGTPLVRPAYLKEQLKRVCRIPKVLHYPILEEMQHFGLIKKLNSQLWEVLNNDCEKKVKKYPVEYTWRPWD